MDKTITITRNEVNLFEALGLYWAYKEAKTEVRLQVDILLEPEKAAEYLKIIAETMKGEVLNKD